MVHKDKFPKFNNGYSGSQEKNSLKKIIHQRFNSVKAIIYDFKDNIKNRV